MNQELATALQALRFAGYAPRTKLDWGADDPVLNQQMVVQFPQCAQTLAKAEDWARFDGASLDRVLGERSFDFIKVDAPYVNLESLRGAEGVLRKADYILVRANFSDEASEAVFRFMAGMGFRSSELVNFHRGGKGKSATLAADLLFERRVQRPTQSLRYTSLYDRQDLLNYLKARQAECADFTVIDVGASGHPWSHEVATATFDIGPCNTARLHFSGNFNDPRQWDAVLDYVGKHGRFSYAICSHTLEDLSLPQVAIEMLPRIAEAGYISTPSRYLELARPEAAYRGFIHHRWMLDMDGDELVITPKLPLQDYLNYENEPGWATAQDKYELQMTWRRAIRYRELGGLGPTRDAVIEMYRNFFDRP